MKLEPRINFVSIIKIGENISNILNFFVQNKLTLYQIKLNIYIWKSKFTSRKWYLFVSVFPRNVNRINTDQSIYKLSYSV